MSSKPLASGLLSVALLSGCATQQGDLALSADPNFGEAHRYNMAVQTIDPDPFYDDSGAQPGDNGERAAEAVERYRKGQVKGVEIISTSTGSGGPQ